MTGAEPSRAQGRPGRFPRATGLRPGRRCARPPAHLDGERRQGACGSRGMDEPPRNPRRSEGSALRVLHTGSPSNESGRSVRFPCGGHFSLGAARPPRELPSEAGAWRTAPRGLRSREACCPEMTVVSSWATAPGAREGRPDPSRRGRVGRGHRIPSYRTRRIQGRRASAGTPC